MTPEDRPTRDTPPPDRSQLTCSECGVVFLTPAQLMAHVESAHVRGNL